MGIEIVVKAENIEIHDRSGKVYPTERGIRAAMYCSIDMLIFSAG